MSRSIAPIIFVSTLLAAPPCAFADAVADLHALFDREWERDLSDNPLAATYLGDSRYNDRLPDISPAAEAAASTSGSGWKATTDSVAGTGRSKTRAPASVQTTSDRPSGANASRKLPGPRVRAASSRPFAVPHTFT